VRIYSHSEVWVYPAGCANEFAPTFIILLVSLRSLRALREKGFTVYDLGITL